MFEVQVELWVPCFIDNGVVFNKLQQEPTHLVIIKDLTIEGNEIKLEYLELINTIKTQKLY